MRLPVIRLQGNKVQMHLLVLLLFLIVMMLSGPAEAFAALAALAVHEAGHIAAAKFLGIRTKSLELMPFGAAIHLDNPYGEPLARLFLMSAAGPLASMLSGAVFYAAGWGEYVKASLLIAGFNLIPALPLDGGRMLYAALSPGIGRRRALAAGIFIGRCLAALLCGIAVAGVLAGGRFNITVAVASAFLFTSAGKEKSALNDACAHGMLQKVRPEKPMQVRAYALDVNTSPHEALALCSPGEASLFLLYDNGKYRDVLDAGEVLRRATQSDADSIGDLARMTCENGAKRV